MRKRDVCEAPFGALFDAPLGAVSKRDFCDAPFGALFGAPFRAVRKRDFCDAPFGALFGAPFRAVRKQHFCVASFGAQLVKIYRQQCLLSSLDCQLSLVAGLASQLQQLVVNFVGKRVRQED